MKPTIYLDNAATTFPKPQSVIDAVTIAMQELSVNAGRGSYNLARKAAAVIDDCRQRLLELAGLDSEYKVLFSPSATLALNQIIFGLALTNNSNIYVSPFEHNAVLRPVHEICSRLGCKMHILPFDKESWDFNVDKCRSQFAAFPPSAVFATLISNVSGYELPVENIAKLAREFGSLCIVDVSQALGAIEFNYKMANADAYVFAGHKTLYGPFGIGGALIKKGVLKYPFIYGGTGSDSLSLNMPTDWPTQFEASSPNITSIYGLSASVQWIMETKLNTIQSHETSILNQLIANLKNSKNTQLYMSPDNTKHHGIVAFNIKNYVCTDVASILDDEYGIAVRAGYHCAGLFSDWCELGEHKGCIRVGLSYFNTDSDIVKLCSALSSL